MNFDRTIIREVHVLTPKKNLMGQEETLVLRGAVEEIAGRGSPKVVIDLGKISFANSTGIGALVGMMTTCRNRRGAFAIARIEKRIKEVLVITQLIRIMPNFDTVEEAVAYVETAAAAAQAA
jgi:anti-sigma B factor antagonist